MGATMTTVSNILKEVYEGSIREQLQNEAVGLKRIERTSEGVTNTVGGKYVVFPIHTRRNAGIGARNEMEALPTPGQQGYASAQVGLKYLYGGVRLSGQTFELADKDFQTFASVLDQEINGLKTDLVKDQNRQFYGDGRGVLGTALTATTSTNTFLVDTTVLNYFEVGQQIDILDSTGATVRASNRQITAISGGTITFDGAAISTSVGDIAVRTGSYNREPYGLGALVGTQTLFNVNPATEPKWQSVIDTSGSNRALSEGLVITNVDTVRVNGGKTSLLLGNLGVRRAYFQLLVQARRYTNTQDFTGGFKGLAFTTDQGDVPWIADVDCPFNTLYGLDESNIKLYREAEWEWMNRDGSNWQRVVGYDAYDATYYMYCQMGIHRRNSQFKIDHITEG